MLFKNYCGSIGCWWKYACLSLTFIKVQWFHIILRDTQTFGVTFFFFKKRYD